VVYAEEVARGKAIREMTVDEIYELVDKFAEGAWRLQQAGFDCVELHGAHGYLIAQFMSPYVNKRNDRFGGSFINRMRFVLEIVHRIQHKCGRDYPIGVRYSGVEWIEGGRELDETVRIAQLLEEHGVAFVDISAGIFEAPAAVMDPMYYPQGWNTYTGEAVKRAVGIPVITSHTLRDPSYCEKILAEGKADMVGLSRQMVADPHWANKAFAGKPDEIRKCISCLVGCWQESLMIRRHMRCAINPAVGDERFLHLKPAEVKCNVAVVGGGPGGMEAARIATLRGHKVTLFERTGELGGAILSCCTVPAKNKMRWYADWLRRQIDKLGVEVRLRESPGVEELKPFDAVILATGGRVAWPEVPGIDAPLVTTFADVLRCRNESCKYFPHDKPPPLVDCGQTVLIWGDHFGAADAAEKLGTDGGKVYVVTENRDFAEWMEPCHKDVMMKRFACSNGEGLTSKTFDQPVTVITSSTVTEIKPDGEVTLMDAAFRKSTVKVDNVVLASVEPDDALYEELLAAGVTAIKIGDASQVRNLRAAVTDGAGAGLTLDEGLRLNANRAMISRLPTEVQLGGE
jgi:thioredoxin reductase